MIDSYEKYRQVAKYAGGYFEEQFLELIKRLEAAEKERDAAELMSLALRAKIAEMEQQEPVRHEFQWRDGDWYPFIDQRHYENTVADGTWPIRALYALPGAQGEEK